MINTKDIQKLREETQAPIMECKKALEETKGDKEKAKEILQKKGELRAGKKQDRLTQSGIIEPYIHANGKIGVLIELRCETDSVANNEDFHKLAHDVAMQVAATNPPYLSSQTIPSQDLEGQKKKYTEDIKDDKKPLEIKEKIIQGRLVKFFQENCLEEQMFIKDESKTIKDLINEATAKFGEKIEIGHFARFQI